MLGFHRIGKTDQPKHLNDRGAALRLAHVSMQSECLANLVADGMQRRQSGHRLLEDDRDAPTPDRLHFPAARLEPGDVNLRTWAGRVGEHDLPLLDARDPRQDAHDRLRHDRLARARFSDQRHRAARGNAERDAVDGLDRSGVDFEVDFEIAYSENFRHSAVERADGSNPVGVYEEQ